ncbi:MAG: arsinothricin resistance N-acetyltransferase ArsN1 family B [Myxococcota bacterium]
MIRDAQLNDDAAITAIYNHYVEHTVVTFEEEPLQPAALRQRIRLCREGGFPWLVAEEEEGVVVGYAYASAWKARSAYRKSVEVTIYLDKNSGRRGLGTQLYRALFEELGERGYHTAIGGIVLPNPASVALHEKLGMTKVAHFKEVGFKFGQWLDVGYWQRLL